MEIMHEMNKNNFTHVPIMENGIMVGVFSENVIFSFLVKNEIALIEKNKKISEFVEFLPLDGHPGEYFHFIPRNSLIIDVQNIFKNQLAGNKRLGALYITENGNQNEIILGMLTAWDIVGK